RLLAERHELLADSNLDWGQDLRRLKAYVDRHGIRDLKLAYFGLGSPRQLGLIHSKLPGGNYYSDVEPEWGNAGVLKPGDWVAVSLSNYVGLGTPQDRDYYRRLLDGLRPVTTIGRSIAVYRIPAPAFRGAGD